MNICNYFSPSQLQIKVHFKSLSLKSFKLVSLGNLTYSNPIASQNTTS